MHRAPYVCRVKLFVFVKVTQAQRASASRNQIHFRFWQKSICYTVLTRGNHAREQREVSMTKKSTNKLDHNAAALKRWRSRLSRAVRMVEKLEKQRKRLEVAAAAPPKAIRPRGHFVLNDPSTFGPAIQEAMQDQGVGQITPPTKSDDLAIPAFLQRKKLDPVAEQIKAEQEATKRAKGRGRIEKMKAKQRGDLKKMPLTGRAALDAIRNA